MLSFSNGHAARNRRDARPLAATARSRHLRVCAGFINKYKSVRIKRRLRPFPFFARLRHVFAVLLAGVQRFFYS